MSLQYGVPLEVYVTKFSPTRFEPMGHTKNPDIRIAKSLVDYIFRWLGITFLPGYREASLGFSKEAPAATDDADAERAGGQASGASKPKAATPSVKSDAKHSNGAAKNGPATNGAAKPAVSLSL